MKNFIQKGAMISVGLTADVLSGAGVLTGAMFGVAATDGKSGETITVAREGVFQLKKTGAQAWDAGQKVYWNDTAKQCTTAASGNTHIGYAGAAAADPSETGVVVLL